MNSESDYLMKLIKKINEKNTEVIKENKTDDIEFLYRGHGKQEYMLQPSLYRQTKSEKDIFSYIMTKHSNEFIGMKPLEVLAKMQHLGVATRLLDVTKNPLVGFFSVDGLKPSEKEHESKESLKKDSFDNGEKESVADTAIKESSNNNENNNLENAELIIFNCPNRDIKSYYSDTIKLLEKLEQDYEAMLSLVAKKQNLQCKLSEFGNNISIVFQNEKNEIDRNILFTGDIGAMMKYIESNEDQRIPMHSSYDVIKIPHHGTSRYYHDF